MFQVAQSGIGYQDPEPQASMTMDSNFGSGSNDLLDMLAEIASNELKSSPPSQPEQPPTFAKPAIKAKRRRNQVAQPKRLVDYDEFDVEQLKKMSMATLLRLFAEQDFDEIRRTFKYTCALMPHKCNYETQVWICTNF